MTTKRAKLANLIQSLDQQHADGTLYRNMKIVFEYRIHGVTYQALADKYGLSKARIGMIMKAWNTMLETIRQSKEDTL